MTMPFGMPPAPFAPPPMPVIRRAYDPLSAHILVAESTIAHIQAAERLMMTFPPERTPERDAFFATLMQLRAAHESFGQFAGGMAEAHARLALAYAALPAMQPPTHGPNGEPLPLMPFPQGMGRDGGDLPMIAPMVAAVAVYTVPTAVIDALALAAADVPGDAGMQLALIVQEAAPAEQDGMSTIRLTDQQRTVLGILRPTSTAVAALLVAIAGAVEDDAADEDDDEDDDEDGDEGQEEADDKTRDETDGVPRRVVAVGSVEALNALRSLPEYKAARAVGVREALFRAVDAVVHAVTAAMAQGDGPWRVDIPAAEADLLSRALAAVVQDASIARFVHPLREGVRVE